MTRVHVRAAVVTLALAVALTPLRSAHAEPQASSRPDSEFSALGSVLTTGRFTSEAGLRLEYAYHIKDWLAVSIGGQYNFVASANSFVETELITKARQQPFTASAAIVEWFAHAGVVFKPLRYTSNLLGGSQAVLFVGASGGAARTIVQLRPADPINDRGSTFGTLGYSVLGLVRIGLDLDLVSERLGVRLELRKRFMPVTASTINGCTYKDLQAVATSPRGKASVPADCNQNAFPDNVADGQIAADQVRDLSDDLRTEYDFSMGIYLRF